MNELVKIVLDTCCFSLYLVFSANVEKGKNNEIPARQDRKTGTGHNPQNI
jgi:hypothetical protein